MATPETTKQLAEADPEEGLAKLKQMGQWVLLAVAAAFLGVTGFQWLQSREAGVRQEVYLAYTTAFTPEALSQVVEAYPEAPEAALARIQMGGMYFRDGEYEEALAVYDTFLAEHATHPMRGEVEVARWMTVEAMGELEAALAGFEAVPETAVMAAQAQFGRARVLEKLGRAAEAVAVYAAIEAAYPETAWAFQAERFREAAALAARSGD